MATDLIVEERIPNVFCDPGGNLNIVLTILVVLGIDAITKGVALVSDRPEGTGRESARWWVGVDSGHVLEQPHPPLMFVSITECTVTVLLRA